MCVWASALFVHSPGGAGHQYIFPLNSSHTFFFFLSFLPFSYSLHLSSLFPYLSAFKNLIVNGLVLASDGKKMSKRLSNYPDPLIVLKKYGAGTLRHTALHY